VPILLRPWIQIFVLILLPFWLLKNWKDN
jgi:hypothetical protein